MCKSKSRAYIKTLQAGLKGTLAELEGIAVRAVIVAVVLAAYLASCGPTLVQTPPSIPCPVKPTLDVIPRDDGGVCFARDDAAKLAEYIVNVEACTH